VRSEQPLGKQLAFFGCLAVCIIKMILEEIAECLHFLKKKSKTSGNKAGGESEKEPEKLSGESEKDEDAGSEDGSEKSDGESAKENEKDTGEELKGTASQQKHKVIENPAHWCQHILTVENLLDMIQIGLHIGGVVIWVTYLLEAREEGSTTEPTTMENPSKAWIAVTIVSAWMRLLYGLRGFEAIGPRLLPIIWAIRDTSIFFFVVLMFLFSWTHVYYLFSTREEPGLFYAAFLQIFRLGLFGDFDLFEMEGVDPTWVQDDQNPGIWNIQDPDPTGLGHYEIIHVVFFLAGFSVTIILMNLLIGVLGTNYDIYEDLSRPLFVRERARLCLNYATRPWRKCCSEFSDDEYLVMALHRDESGDDLRSMRSNITNGFKKQSEEIMLKIDKGLGRKFDALSKNMHDCLSRLGKLEQSNEAIRSSIPRAERTA